MKTEPKIHELQDNNNDESIKLIQKQSIWKGHGICQFLTLGWSQKPLVLDKMKFLGPSTSPNSNPGFWRKDPEISCFKHAFCEILINGQLQETLRVASLNKANQGTKGSRSDREAYECKRSQTHIYGEDLKNMKEGNVIC